MSFSLQLKQIQRGNDKQWTTSKSFYEKNNMIFTTQKNKAHGPSSRTGDWASRSQGVLTDAGSAHARFRRSFSSPAPCKQSRYAGCPSGPATHSSAQSPSTNPGCSWGRASVTLCPPHSHHLTRLSFFFDPTFCCVFLQNAA